MAELHITHTTTLLPTEVAQYFVDPQKISEWFAGGAAGCAVINGRNAVEIRVLQDYILEWEYPASFQINSFSPNSEKILLQFTQILPGRSASEHSIVRVAIEVEGKGSKIDVLLSGDFDENCISEDWRCLRKISPKESEVSSSAVPHKFHLLRHLIKEHDAVLMNIRKVRPQEYLGNAIEIYSRRFEGGQKYDEGPISFVGSPGTWGTHELEDGEEALVFINYIPHSKRYYQGSWRAHFTIMELEGIRHGVASWELPVGLDANWYPEYLRKAAFLIEPIVPRRVAMPFGLIEKHLLEELNLLEAGRETERGNQKP